MTETPIKQNGKKKKTVYVWDPAVRLFHWSLVIAFTVAYLSGEGDEDLHVQAGYVVLGLVLFRIVWGFVGSRYARFSDFVYGPGEIARYFTGVLQGRAPHYLGHNPAGGLMVITLLACLLGVSWTGLKLYGAEGHGPLAGAPIVLPSAHADEDGDEDGGHDEAAEEYWEALHEVIANLTLALVFVHVIAVLVSSRLHRENLVKAMITGRKEIEIDE